MPGRLVIYVAASIDGFIADADGGVAWLDAYNSKDFEFESFFKHIDTIVMGRNTYDQVMNMGVAWPYGDRRAIILSNSELGAGGPATAERFEGDIGPLVDNLRQNAETCWLVGGADVFRSFLSEGAVDELILFLIPVVLGDGVRLFGAGEGGFSAALRSAQPFANGVVRLNYAAFKEVSA